MLRVEAGEVDAVRAYAEQVLAECKQLRSEGERPGEVWPFEVDGVYVQLLDDGRHDSYGKKIVETERRALVVAERLAHALLAALDSQRIAAPAPIQIGALPVILRVSELAHHRGSRTLPALFQHRHPDLEPLVARQRQERPKDLSWLAILVVDDAPEIEPALKGPLLDVVKALIPRGHRDRLGPAQQPPPPKRPRSIVEWRARAAAGGGVGTIRVATSFLTDRDGARPLADSELCGHPPPNVCAVPGLAWSDGEISGVSRWMDSLVDELCDEFRNLVCGGPVMLRWMQQMMALAGDDPDPDAADPLAIDGSPPPDRDHHQPAEPRTLPAVGDERELEALVRRSLAISSQSLPTFNPAQTRAETCHLKGWIVGNLSRAIWGYRARVSWTKAPLGFVERLGGAARLLRARSPDDRRRAAQELASDMPRAMRFALQFADGGPRPAHVQLLRDLTDAHGQADAATVPGLALARDWNPVLLPCLVRASRALRAQISPANDREARNASVRALLAAGDPRPFLELAAWIRDPATWPDELRAAEIRAAVELLEVARARLLGPAGQRLGSWLTEAQAGEIEAALVQALVSVTRESGSQRSASVAALELVNALGYPGPARAASGPPPGGDPVIARLRADVVAAAPASDRNAAVLALLRVGEEAGFRALVSWIAERATWDDERRALEIREAVILAGRAKASPQVGPERSASIEQALIAALESVTRERGFPHRSRADAAVELVEHVRCDAVVGSRTLGRFPRARAELERRLRLDDPDLWPVFRRLVGRTWADMEKAIDDGDILAAGGLALKAEVSYAEDHDDALRLACIQGLSDIQAVQRLWPATVHDRELLKSDLVRFRQRLRRARKGFRLAWEMDVDEDDVGAAGMEESR